MGNIGIGKTSLVLEFNLAYESQDSTHTHSRFRPFTWWKCEACYSLHWTML